MSIADDMQRIEEAKYSLWDWLCDNGVTVPVNARIDDLVRLLADFNLEDAKSALSYFLTGNGVTVPNGTKLDEMTALLADVDVGNDSFKTFIEAGQTRTGIVWPDGLTAIGQYAFDGNYALDIPSLPDSVTNIWHHAFHNCSSLSLEILPDGVTNIAGGAFNGCSNMLLKKLPEALISIGMFAFYDCYNLAINSIPANVKGIYAHAFSNTNITTITFEGTPEEIDDTAFADTPNLTAINVPWAEGEVAGAPWGATNATINYNYTGE